MKIFTKILLISLLCILIINPGRLPGDTMRRLNVTHAWVTGTEEVNLNEQQPNLQTFVEINGNRYHAIDDLGQSILMIPGDWLGEQISSFLNQNNSQFIRRLIIISLIFIPLNLVAIAAVFWFLQLFGFSEKQAGLASLIFLLCTTFLHYSQYHQQNNQILAFAALGYGCALASVKSEKFFWAILSGLSVGMVFLIRTTGAFHVLTVLLFLIACAIYKFGKPLKVSQIVLFWGMGFAPLFLLRGTLHSIRYGTFFGSGPSLVYKQWLDSYLYLPPNYPWNNPPYIGIWGVLFSPAKSIFIYDFLLLPSLILGVILWKKLSIYLKIYLITALFNLILHIVATSKLDFWGGDGAWGARYHVTSVHLLLIPLIALWVQEILSMKKWKKILLQVILAVTLFIQINSVTFLPTLETNKLILQPPSYFLKFRLGERIFNSTCVIQSFIGSADKNCPEELKISHANLANYIQLFAFRFQDRLIFTLILLSWFVLLVSTIIYLVRFCFQVS